MTTSSDSAIDLVSNVIAYSAIVPIALFIFFYGTRPRPGHKWLRRPSGLWLSTPVGKTLMFQMIAWIFYLTFVTAKILYKDWDGRDILRLIIYSGLTLLFWAFFIALRHLQKQPKIGENELAIRLDSDDEQTKPRHDPNTPKK